jgi:bacterioferritin-associated ferredoxin
VFVCSCRATTSGTVRQVIAAGARTVRDVAVTCGACQDCGRCAVHIRALLEEHYGPRERGRISSRNS